MLQFFIQFYLSVKEVFFTRLNGLIEVDLELSIQVTIVQSVETGITYEIY